MIPVVLPWAWPGSSFPKDKDTIAFSEAGDILLLEMGGKQKEKGDQIQTKVVQKTQSQRNLA